MSYANKKERIFREGEFIYLPHTRSESRMKRYSSATDLRSWCHTVELRRQHILELMARNRVCLEKYLPLDVVFSSLTPDFSSEREYLEKKIEYLEKELDIYGQIGLNDEQKREVDRLMKKRNIKPPQD